MSFSIIETDYIHRSLELLQPTMPFLVTTLNQDNSINIAPFSWATPVSQFPPMFGLALLNKPKKQDSLKNIEREKEFVVNIVDLRIAKRLVESSYEYPIEIKKFYELEFKPFNSQKIKTPGITEARAHIECKVEFLRETGDHMLIISHILAANYNTKYYTSDLLLDLSKASPIVHLAQYRMESSQLHIFIKQEDLHVLNVPYRYKMNF